MYNNECEDYSQCNVCSVRGLCKRYPSYKYKYKYNNNSNKLNITIMKPFNLEEAKAGKPVCTRDGRPARIICFDRKSDYSIIALILIDGEEIPFSFTKDGKRINNNEDLMMISEKHEGWINLYKDKYDNSHSQEVFLGHYIHNSKKAAKETSKEVIEDLQHVATIKIEWEE